MVSYQFYFLFFTSRWVAGKNFTEPDKMADFSPEQANLVCKLYEDKRLFRFELSCEEILTGSELVKQLADYKEQIDRYYGSAVQNEALLYGVSVVIIDPELTGDNEYIINIPIQQEDTCTWAQFGTSGDKLCFRTSHDTQPTIYLADFELETHKLPAKFRHTDQWQIKFESEQALLAPLQYKESEHHPILHFYGLIWKNPFSQPKPDILDDMILNGLLLEAMPYLLMTRWQFAHIFLSADRIIQELDEQAGNYRDVKDVYLASESLSQLREELQKMEHLEATTQYELSRTTQSIQTIENNINKLSGVLQNYHDKLNKKHWTPEWLWRVESLKYLRQEQAETIPALLEQARYASKELNNKSIYIEGLLKHLQGSKLRWLNLVAQKEHETQERLNVLVNGLVILGTVMSVFELLKDNGVALSSELQVATVTILFVLIYSRQFFAKFFKGVRSKT